MAPRKQVEYAVVELGGISYAILRQAQLSALCKRAGVHPVAASGGATLPTLAPEHEGAALAARLRQRRRAAGLTQAALAAAAGIRTETLNRIERGRTEPDFRTIRKLAVALRRLETAS